MILLTFLIVFAPILVLIELLRALVDHPIVTIFGGLFALTIYFMYPVIVGLKLRSLLSSQALYTRRKSFSLIVDWCMIVIPYAITGLVDLKENVSYVILGVVGLVGFVRLGSFPAREIRSIELRRNASMWEYVSETVQMVYWPLGVLWMQPRINKIANRTITISE